MAYLPVENIGVPFGTNPTPPAPVITADTPIYSSYTQQYVQHGPIKKGTLTDAPSGHKFHGKPFHVVVHNPANNTYMVHRTDPNIVVRAPVSPSYGSYGSSYGSYVSSYGSYGSSSGPHALGSGSGGSYGSYGSSGGYPSGVVVHQGGYVTGVNSYGYFN